MHNIPSPGTDDASIEAQIKAKGLTAPRVTKDDIDALMARVRYIGGRVDKTTSTVVHAFLDGEFLLASGHSACVSPENFDADLGYRMARKQAEDKARDQLWLLEGYALRKRLASAPAPRVAQAGAAHYIGTKEIFATPMNRADYNVYRGWELPADENGADEGFLVEYIDGGKANDSRHAGYISWSPAEVFERAYKRVS